METIETPITERLAAQRILPSSDIPPHQFLFSWHSTPCFARGEQVAVTGKAKSGKTYLTSILMAIAGCDSRDREPLTDVRSRRFADTLINEARDLKIITSMVSRDGYKRYGLVYEKELFDETF